MKIAIITDIHEDFANLEKAIKGIERVGYDALVCLGDITGFSTLHYSHHPDANACIDLIRDKANLVIAGNHDLFTCGRLPSYHLKKNMPANWYTMPLEERIKLAGNKIWLYLDEEIPALSPDNMDFLKTLKEWEVLEYQNRKYLFTHFFRPDITGTERWFPFNSLEIRDHFRFMKEQGCSLAFVGHKHPPAPVRINSIFWSNPNDEPTKIRKHHKAVICPAIVGERYLSSFTTFDIEKQIVETHTVI